MTLQPTVVTVVGDNDVLFEYVFNGLLRENSQLQDLVSDSLCGSEEAWTRGDNIIHTLNTYMSEKTGVQASYLTIEAIYDAMVTTVLSYCTGGYNLIHIWPAIEATLYQYLVAMYESGEYKDVEKHFEDPSDYDFTPTHYDVWDDGFDLYNIIYNNR